LNADNLIVPGVFRQEQSGQDPPKPPSDGDNWDWAVLRKLFRYTCSLKRHDRCFLALIYRTSIPASLALDRTPGEDEVCAGGRKPNKTEILGYLVDMGWG
jgi:hypothetical protein